MHGRASANWSKKIDAIMAVIQSPFCCMSIPHWFRANSVMRYVKVGTSDWSLVAAFREIEFGVQPRISSPQDHRTILHCSKLIPYAIDHKCNKMFMKLGVRSSSNKTQQDPQAFRSSLNEYRSTMTVTLWIEIDVRQSAVLLIFKTKRICCPTLSACCMLYPLSWGQIARNSEKSETH